MEGPWQTCVVDSDYEICTEYPYQIRRKGSDKIIKESIHKTTGYIRCSLNCKQYYKHLIIAKQFIPNDAPEIKIQVDHINRIKTDNRVENLRWVSPSENCKNRNTKGYKYEFVDQLPEDVIPVILYKGIEFEDYYYSKSEDKFYYDNGIQYRIIHINKSGFGYKMFSARDITGKSRSIYVDKWKRDNGFD